jgi:hypothetical protein
MKQLKDTAAFEDFRRYMTGINLISHIYRYLFNPGYRLIYLYRRINAIGGG